MEDRLAEFRAVEKPGVAPVQIKNITPTLMPEFSSKMKVLQQTINQVKYNNTEITKLKEQMVASTLNDQERKLSMELSRYIELNKGLCNKVKVELETLLLEVNKDKTNFPNEPETRIKFVGYQAFSNKFAAILKEFQKVQMEYKDAVKVKFSRQAKQMNENLSEQQIQDIINDPEGIQRLFSQQLLGKTHTKIQNALSDIQDKYNDIKRLEQGVIAIHQMFVDLAVLVQAQGITIDSIELNVNSAQNYVKKATEKLKEAKSDHGKAKKWKYIVMLIILVIAVVVIFVVLK